MTRLFRGLLVTVVVGGCTPGRDLAPPPTHLVVVCDASAPGAPDCTPELLERLACDWYAEAMWRPGSQVLLVEPAGRFQDVRATTLASVDAPPANPRRAKPAFRAALDRTLAGVVLEDGSPGERRNRSELLSAVSVAATRATALPEGEVILVLASDGLTISGDINLERRAATAGHAERFIAAQRLPWDLSVFDEVNACGWSNAGTTSVLDAARRDFWPAVLALGGARLHEPVAPDCSSYTPSSVFTRRDPEFQ